MWFLKLLAQLAAVIPIIAKLLEERQAAQAAKATARTAADQRQAGVDAQVAAQTSEVLHEVAVAQDARLGMETELARDPASLWDDDGFERKPAGGGGG